MIKDCIKSAPTIEEAKAAALLELGLSEEDIYTVEVLQAPVKKTLGLFGGKPAQVKVSVEVPDEVKPAEKKPEKKENNQPKKAEKKKEKAPRQDSPVEVAIIAKKEDALKKTDEYDKAAEYVKGIILGLGM